MAEQSKGIIKRQDESTKALLSGHQRSIAALLPPQMPPAKFMRTIANALARSPYLAGTKPDRRGNFIDTDSLILAIFNAAGAGLECDGREGALVPFKGKVQFIPMYQGLVKLARQSGEISTINVVTVRRGDDFSYRMGLEPMIHHVPAEGTKYGDWTHVYAVVRFKDGGYQFRVMSKMEVMRIKAKSPAASSGDSPWKTDEEAMAEKTVLKQALKLCPQSTELSRAIALDNAADIGHSQDAVFDLDSVQLQLSRPEEDDGEQAVEAEPEPPESNGRGGLV